MNLLVLVLLSFVKPGDATGAQPEAEAPDLAQACVDRITYRDFYPFGVGLGATIANPGHVNLTTGPWTGHFRFLTYGIPVGTTAGFSAGVSVPLDGAPPALLVETDLSGVLVAVTGGLFAQGRFDFHENSQEYRVGLSASLGSTKAIGVEARLGGGVENSLMGQPAVLAAEIGLKGGITLKTRTVDRIPAWCQ